jgi:hypothetical protein
MRHIDYHESLTLLYCVSIMHRIAGLSAVHTFDLHERVTLHEACSRYHVYFCTQRLETRELDGGYTDAAMPFLFVTAV